MPRSRPLCSSASPTKKNGPYWAECNGGGAPVCWLYRLDRQSRGERSATEAALLSAGYIDSTGNLVATHDAATAHLGSPWRMPTDAEFESLVNNCTTTWTSINGVNGLLVTGKGDYADRSIFLPAAGNGYDSYLYGAGSGGGYCSSRLGRRLLLLYAEFGQFVPRVGPRLRFGRLRPERLRQPLQRVFCSSCSRICRVARELRAYPIHSIHSDSFHHGVV